MCLTQVEVWGQRLFALVMDGYVVCSCEFGDMSKSTLRGLSTRLIWKIQSFSNQNHENSCFWKLSAGQKAGN
jgi:hypothetical protein